jgi:hypothetical protein
LAHIWLDSASPVKVVVTVPVQLSLAVGAAGLGAGTWLVQFTEMVAGQAMVGGVWSFTVINCEQVAVFPHPSVTV